MDKTIKTLTEVLQESKKEGTTPYDTTAEVVRIEGKTAWVHIPGGIDETPVNMTIAASVGDTVQVRIAGGRAWITGNQSAPPTDDKKATAAQKSADKAKVTADDAKVTADNAEELAAKANRAAQNVNQYFWHTETDTGAGAGAHITEVTQEEFLDDPDNGGGNLLAQSGGIFIRDGLQEIAKFNGDLTSQGAPRGKLHLSSDISRLEGYSWDSGTNIYTETKLLATDSAQTVEGNVRLTASDNSQISTAELQAESADNKYASIEARCYYGASGHIEIAGDNGADVYCRLPITTAGDITAGGDITANGHGTPIGYNNTGSGTKNNFPNNSQQELVSGISVTAGTWLLICRVGFPSNATGRRFACWHNNTTAADYYTSYSTSPAANGGYTNVQTVMAIQVSGNTTFSVHAFQNSGSAMNVAYNWSIVRIA